MSKSVTEKSKGNLSPSELHKGHRERLRSRFKAEGLRGFADHEVLEFILTFAIPRINTNDIAHRLINEFGSLQGVLNASTDNLCRVDGVGENSAILIRLFSQVANIYVSPSKANGKAYKTLNDFGFFFVNYFVGETKEKLTVMSLDPSMRLIACDDVHIGTLNTGIPDAEKIAEILFSRNASAFALAHNHLGGSAQPSQDDIKATLDIRDIFSRLNKPLIEHIVVSGSEFACIVHDYIK